MDIQIRRLEPGDYEAVQKLFTGSKAMQGTLQLPYPSIESWRKRLAEPTEGLYDLVACIGDELVGQLGLHIFHTISRRRHAGQVGMAVRDDWQGKGVGTALMQAAVDIADNWLNLRRLELQVYIDNEPAVHLYQKFGFEIEGTLADFAFRDGQYVDAYMMARVRKN